MEVVHDIQTVRPEAYFHLDAKVMKRLASHAIFEQLFLMPISNRRYIFQGMRGSGSEALLNL